MVPVPLPAVTLSLSEEGETEDEEVDGKISDNYGDSEGHSVATPKWAGDNEDLLGCPLFASDSEAQATPHYSPTETESETPREAK